MSADSDLSAAEIRIYPDARCRMCIRANRPNPLRFVEQFADQLVEQGLRFVDGDIIGDDSAYAMSPFRTAGLWTILYTTTACPYRRCF